MRIIGHRGAAGLELENTIASLKKALEVGVSGVEFDIRLTADRQLVLCHDDDLSRVSNSSAKICELTLNDLKQVDLNNGERIPTLAEALAVTGSTWTIIEAKVMGCAKELLEVLDNFPDANVTVASFKHGLAAELEVLRPSLSVFLAEKTRPTEILRMIRHAKADGMDLNAWLLNPLTYWLARRRNLDIMVYTINNRFVASFINTLYPGVAICTDHPERFVKRSKMHKLPRHD
jgi:glycerophosphoryl diester phosphodiesterase